MYGGPRSPSHVRLLDASRRCRGVGCTTTCEPPSSRECRRAAKSAARPERAARRRAFQPCINSRRLAVEVTHSRRASRRRGSPSSSRRRHATPRWKPVGANCPEADRVLRAWPTMRRGRRRLGGVVQPWRREPRRSENWRRSRHPLRRSPCEKTRLRAIDGVSLRELLRAARSSDRRLRARAERVDHRCRPRPRLPSDSWALRAARPSLLPTPTGRVPTASYATIAGGAVPRRARRGTLRGGKLKVPAADA